MSLREIAKRMKQDVGTLYFVYLDKRTPMYAKIIAIIVVGYALSPIDLVPDFIPVLGYLDDVILLPLGIYLTLKLVPASIVEEARLKSDKYFSEVKPLYIWPIFFVVSFWAAIAIVIYMLISK